MHTTSKHVEIYNNLRYTLIHQTKIHLLQNLKKLGAICFLKLKKILCINDKNYKWWVLAIVGTGTFMAANMSSVLNIALPHITEYFHTSLSTSEWIIMSYLLVISSLLLTYGRLGDMYGYKPIYILGFSIFTLGSILCSLAPTIGYLIAFRVVQGIGGGMVMAMSPAITTYVFPDCERGRALGINGAVLAVSMAFGPTFGGFILNYFSWHYIFLMCVPIGLLGITCAQLILRPKKNIEKQHFDLIGASVLALTLTSLLLALSHGEAWGWNSAVVLSLLIFSAVGIFTFTYIESHIKEPMMSLQLFQNRVFTMGNITLFLNFMAQFSIVLLLPFYLTLVKHLNPAYTGLLMSASPAVLVFASPISGALSDRIGFRVISSVGMGIITVVLLLFNRLLSTDTSYFIIAALLSLFGLGNGMFHTPNSSAIMGSVSRNFLGVAAGTMACMRNIGMVTGIAVSGAVFTNRLLFYTKKLQINQGFTGPLLENTAYVLALKDTYLLAAVLACAGILTSLARSTGGRSRKTSTDTSNNICNQQSLH